MQLISTTKDCLQEKPQIGARIDFGHPLAKGLIGCWLFNEGAGKRSLSLVRPIDYAIPDSDGFYWHPSMKGPSIKVNDTGDNTKNIRVGNPMYGKVTANATIIVMTQILSFNNIMTFVFGGRAYDCNSALQVGRWGGGEWGYMWNGSHYDWDSNIVYNPNKVEFVALAVQPTQGLLFVDGQLAINVNTHTAETFNNVYFYLGRDEGNWDRYNIGKYVSAYLYDRTLSLGEIRHLYQDPYCFFFRRQWTAGGIVSNPYPTARLRKGLVSGYHCFMSAYLKAKVSGYDPLKLPDGTVF